MALAVQDEQRTLADLKKKTEEITRVVQARNLDEIIHKSKELVIKDVTEEEKKVKDEATLRLIEQIKRVEVEDAKTTSRGKIYAYH